MADELETGKLGVKTVVALVFQAVIIALWLGSMRNRLNDLHDRQHEDRARMDQIVTLFNNSANALEERMRSIEAQNAATASQLLNLNVALRDLAQQRDAGPR